MIGRIINICSGLTSIEIHVSISCFISSIPFYLVRPQKPSCKHYYFVIVLNELWYVFHWCTSRVSWCFRLNFSVNARISLSFMKSVLSLTFFYCSPSLHCDFDSDPQWGNIEVVKWGRLLKYQQLVFIVTWLQKIKVCFVLMILPMYSCFLIQS